MISVVSGLCGVSIRKALHATFHLPEEEPQEEADGFLLFLHVGQIPLRATQLHRPARHGHPRKTGHLLASMGCLWCSDTRVASSPPDPAAL